MKKIRIGIICPSEIAFRRFMPALQQCEELQYVGVAYATVEEWFGTKDIAVETADKMREQEHGKAETFLETYGGKVFDGYEAMLASGELDAVYLPLPPALHFQWANKALEYGLHIFVEKPSTTCLADSTELIELAQKKALAVHENYMFAFHKQLSELKEIVDGGAIGEVRLYRIDFGFPRRALGDFRYNKKLGGGALLDCGGYTLKYADMLLNHDATMNYAMVHYTEGIEVEIFGSAALSNQSGQTVQVAFGMDNDYRCSVNIWGSTGTITSNRILTAPAGFTPEYTISRNGKTENYSLSEDDTFYKSMKYFVKCVRDKEERQTSYQTILHQAELVEQFRTEAGL